MQEKCVLVSTIPDFDYLRSMELRVWWNWTSIFCNKLCSLWFLSFLVLLFGKMATATSECIEAPLVLGNLSNSWWGELSCKVGLQVCWMVHKSCGWFGRFLLKSVYRNCKAPRAKKKGRMPILHEDLHPVCSSFISSEVGLYGEAVCCVQVISYGKYAWLIHQTAHESQYHICTIV